MIVAAVSSLFINHTEIKQEPQGALITFVQAVDTDESNVTLVPWDIYPCLLYKSNANVAKYARQVNLRGK